MRKPPPPPIPFSLVPQIELMTTKAHRKKKKKRKERLKERENKMYNQFLRLYSVLSICNDDDDDHDNNYKIKFSQNPLS